MQIIKKLSDKGASEEAIESLEQRLGTALPADYRNFLAAENGGVPGGRSFVIDTGSKQASICAIRLFFTS